MTLTPSAEPLLAERGSQRWLQIAVNRRPDLLDGPIRRSARFADDARVEWRSPLTAERYGEYRDAAGAAPDTVSDHAALVVDIVPAV